MIFRQVRVMSAALVWFETCHLYSHVHGTRLDTDADLLFVHVLLNCPVLCALKFVPRRVQVGKSTQLTAVRQLVQPTYLSEAVPVIDFIEAVCATYRRAAPVMPTTYAVIQILCKFF